MIRICVIYFDAIGAVLMAASLLAADTQRATIDPIVSENWPTGVPIGPTASSALAIHTAGDAGYSYPGKP